ncbi:bifunctional diguanylate cyclase/phosphodiesterase [Shewanella colwelliana]|nr:bifunctional diguanylate cyclase/phosphodiesterase [Shewanella colwelliana]
MINIEVSPNQRNEWQRSFEMIGRFSGVGVALLMVDQNELFVPDISVNLSDEVLIKAVACCAEKHLCRDSVQVSHYPHYANSQATDAKLTQDGYCLLPINWPSQALFGYLYLDVVACVLDEDGVTDALHLLALCQASIERDLSAIYRQYRLENRSNDISVSQSRDISLQLFIDSLKEHVWIKDPSGRYIVVNKSVEAAWSRPKAEIINHTDEELFDSKLAKEFIQSDQESIIRGVQVTAGECEGLDIDDVSSWLETTKVPVISDDGELTGIIGITRNISSHKAAQEQLEMAANVFENSVEGVLITDAKGDIVEVHGAFTDITGYSREEVLGKNPRIFSSGRHNKAFFRSLWQSLLSTGKWYGEIWNRRKSGAIFPEQLTISSMYDDEDQVRYFVAVFADISAQKQSEEELERLVYHDPLTQLPNRMTLSAQLAQELHHAQREQTELALIFIDVDLFKHINDSYGHVAGDTILVDLAKRLSKQLKGQGSLARLGSDEFVALLPHIESRDRVSLMVSLLREVFKAPFVLDDDVIVRLTASMGVALYPGDGDSADTLLRNADAAMHRAKLNGRNNYAFYTQSLTLESVEHLKLQSALHSAITNNAFHLVYQPKLDFSTGETVGFEALLRWVDPLMGNISPAIFIPVAEKIGVICNIGLWVLNSAARQGIEWLKQGKHFGRISVNVAGPQLQDAGFFDEVKTVLEQTGLPPECLELEVTESCMMSDPKAVIKLLKKLGDLGVELSVDDFGTGYSSLNYLKRLPIDKLKIDQSFVRDIPHNANNTAISKAIIALGHALNLTVIAEGVETLEQAEFLRQSGCDEAQGYLYSKPLLPSELNKFLG